MKALYLLGLVPMMMFTSCSGDGEAIEKIEYKPITVPEESQAELAALRSYCHDFIQKAADCSSEGNNMLVSPLCGTVTLGMLANAASPEVKAEILNALGVKESNLANLNSLMANIISELPTLDKQSTSVISSSVWSDSRVTISPEVKSTFESDYKATLKTADLDDQATLKEIYRWCAVNSGRGGEGELAMSVYGNPVILNALNFKSPWRDKFDKNLTKPDKFKNYDGSESDIQMMNNKKLLITYSETETFQWASMILGANGAFHITFLLPKEGVNVESVLKNPVNLMKGGEKYYETAKQGFCNFSMPRLNIKSDIVLNNIWQLQGIHALFEGGGSMPGFAGVEQAVNPAYTQTLASTFDEDGAVAHVISSIDPLWPTDHVYGEIPDFRIDRPFAFAITEFSTGTVLLMGKVSRL